VRRYSEQNNDSCEKASMSQNAITRKDF
jgi:hypothetical protein